MVMVNPIASFNPIPIRATQLEQGEYQHFSFLIIEAEKQVFGYSPKSILQCLCHLTSHRLILEPQPCADDVQAVSTIASALTARFDQASFYEIPYDAIQSFQVVRSFNLSPCVKIRLKSLSPILRVSELLFIASPASEARKQHSFTNCSSHFAVVANQMLQIDQQLIQQIQDSPVPVLVYFWAHGCQPCELFSSVMNEITEQFKDKIQSIRINLEDDPSLPIQYRIDSAPTVLIFKNGAIVDKIEGAIPGALFAKVLKRYL